MALSGVLERAMPPKPSPSPAPRVQTSTSEPEDTEPPAVEETEEPTLQSRGGNSRGKASALAARQAKKIKGRTIYLNDDLFERVMVQSHRKEMTISDYVSWILNRHVPDHQGRGRSAEGDG